MLTRKKIWHILVLNLFYSVIKLCNENTCNKLGRVLFVIRGSSRSVVTFNIILTEGRNVASVTRYISNVRYIFFFVTRQKCQLMSKLIFSLSWWKIFINNICNFVSKKRQLYHSVAKRFHRITNFIAQI